MAKPTLRIAEIEVEVTTSSVALAAPVDVPTMATVAVSMSSAVAAVDVLAVATVAVSTEVRS